MNTPLLPRQAWIVVAMLVAASVISYLDLQVLAVLVAPIKADLGIDDGRIGLLYGVFAVFYAFAGVPVARLSDRYSRKRLITAGMCLWSVMTLLAGLSRTFEHLLLARIGMGIGMAVLTPAATSLIADCFARERTALAVSIFQTGSVVGSGLAFVIGGVLYRLAEHHGPVSVLGLQRLEPWQQVMLLSGLPGLLLAPFMLRLREPPRSFHASTRTPMASWVDVGRFYRRNAQTLALHHGAFLALALVGFGFVFWSVTFLIRTHGMAPAAAAQRFGWIYLIAGTLGSLWAPLLAARFARSGRRDANIFAAMLGRRRHGHRDRGHAVGAERFLGARLLRARAIFHHVAVCARLRVAARDYTRADAGRRHEHLHVYGQPRDPARTAADRAAERARIRGARRSAVIAARTDHRVRRCGPGVTGPGPQALRA